MSPMKMTGHKNHAEMVFLEGMMYTLWGVCVCVFNAEVFKSLFLLSFNILRFIYYVCYFIASDALKMRREEIPLCQNPLLGHLYTRCLCQSLRRHFISRALHSHQPRHHRSSTEFQGSSHKSKGKFLGAWESETMSGLQAPEMSLIPASEKNYIRASDLWGMWWWPEEREADRARDFRTNQLWGASHGRAGEASSAFMSKGLILGQEQEASLKGQETQSHPAMGL